MKVRYSLLLLILLVSAGSQLVFAQTPVTDYPCDPRSVANGGACPTGCNFAVTVEKGCNCFDNLDNDGDGKTDAADGECGSFFGLVFVGSGSSNCSIIPPGGSPFAGIGAPVGSQQNTADTQSKVAVGDVDNDGIPDAVITSKWNGEVRVVATTNGQPDGTDEGKVKADYNLSGKKNDFPSFAGCSPNRLLFEHEVLIADIDKAANGRAEIFTIVSNRGGNPATPPTCFFLLALRYKQSGPGGLEPLYPPIPLGTNRPGIFGVADMDGDGKAEIYLRDRIFAAETGKLLASEGSKTHLNTALWDSDVTSGPVAVNVQGDNKMELVCGTKVYSIPTLTARNPASPAALTLVKDMNVDFPATKCFVKLMNDPDEYGVDTHSATSAADIDGDGFIDVIISGALNSSAGRTAIFYWNIAKNNVSYFLTPNSTELGLAPADPKFTSYSTGWIWGTGRVNIGDANGDGRTDLAFIAGNQLFCLTTNGSGLNMVPLWASPRTIEDSRSGVLTVSIYDFNNDGKPEMVYRDSQSLNVIDASTGQNMTTPWSVACQSHTYTEGPVIADVNGDGATDICVTCNTNNSFDIDDGIQQQALGQVRLYFSNTNSWLPTRKVWNQPGYFVVNINDDLTLPFPQLDQNLIFSNAPCPNGVPGPQRPLNVFLNQVPFMNANGCPVFPAPDLTFIGQDPATADPNAPDYFPAVIVTPPICGNLDIGVVFNIGNTGDLPISDNIPVSFFNGDPQLPGATRLFNTTLNINNLQLGDTITTAPVLFNGPGTIFDLYIVLYNDGSVLPLTLAGASLTECQIANNIYKVTVTPSPFTASINKFKDNEKCVAADPNSGELRARMFKGAVEDLDFSQYSFQWYSGLGTTNPIPVAQGGQNSVITGLVEGDYTLVVTNTQKGCVADPVSANIALSIVIPQVSITLLSDQTQCSPPNGSLQAQVAGGNTGYTFDWFSNAIPLGVSTPLANGLKGDNYTVVVSRNGCTTTANSTVADLAIEPDAQASVLQNVVNCTNLNSGSVTGEALLTGVIQNPAEYTFDWYFYNNVAGTRGSILPPVNGTGPTRTGLAVGFYQLVVTRISTQCVATQTPIVQITDSTVLPEAVITETSPQTSCDPNNPNGVLTADVRIGGVLQDPANFTFEWYKGDNTLAANLHTTVSGVNGRVAENVAGGGVFYTVKVTTTTTCSDTEKLIITEDVNVPVVALTPTDNSICDPTFAGVSFNGSVAASVTFDGVPVVDFSNYKFTWHDGSQTTDPVIVVANDKLPSLSQREDGNYTVVVQRLDLFCTSLPATTVIGNSQVLPVITPGTIPSTNCFGGTPNGQVTVTNVVPAGPYTFRWYAGNSINPGSELTPLNNATLTGLQGGQNFTVEVVVNSSGCKNSITTPLADNKSNPVLSLTPSPNSVCDPALGFNGSIAQNTLTDTNSIVGDGYVYTWSTGSDMNNIIAGQTSSTLPNRNGGFYTATVRNTRLNCTADPVTVEVINNQVFPVITSSTVPSTNCVGGTPNGSTSANVGGLTAGFTFNWFAGNLVTDPAVPAGNGGNTFSTNNLQGGTNFTIKVRNNTSGCENTETILLPDNKQTPVLTLTPAPNSICDPALGFNGSIAQNTLTDVNALGGDTYTFAWSSGNDMTSILVGQTASTLTGRNGGFYSATATNTRLNCTSAPVTVEIINNQVFPVITTGTVPSTNCVGGTPNGSTTANVGGLTAGFTFNWFAGNLITDPAVPVGNGGNTFATNSLQGGLNYTVNVRNNTSGCENTETILLADNKAVPVLTLTPAPNSNCDATIGFNGSVTQNTLVDVNTLVGDTYTFTWSTGNDLSSPIGGQTASSITALDGGFYTASVRNNRLNCVSAPVTVEIQNTQVFPAIVTSAQGSTNCDPLLKNGRTTIVTVDGLAPNASYTYSWFTGNSVAGPSISNTFSASNLQGGPATIATNNYTVEVTNASSGCKNNTTVNVPDVSQLPALTLIPQPNTICDPSKATLGGGAFDGQVGANVTNIPAGNTINDYFFNWNVGTDGNGVNNLPGLDVGTYSVTALHNTTGCLSNVYSAQVTSAKALPTITMDQTPAQNCAGGAAAADGVARVLNVLPNGKNYDYKWFDGNSIAGTAGPSTLNTTLTTNSYSNVQGGINGVSLFQYTVEVTILQTGCVNTATIGVNNDSQLPVVTLTPPIDNTNCSPTKNGSVAVNSVSYRGNPIASPYTGFTLAWAAGGTVGPAPGDTYTALPAGTYTLTVTNTDDQCTSNPVQVTIADDLFLPPIDVVDVDQTSCNPLTPNGSLTATIDETLLGSGTGVTAGYNFNWVDNVTATSTPSNLISNLKGDQTYTITATRISTGCLSTQAIYLNETITTPVVTVNVSDLTTCAPANGSLTATVAPAVGPYNFFWYDGNDAVDANAVIAGADFTGGAVYSGLIPGEYTVVARNTVTTCLSQQVIEVVSDASPAILPVVANIIVPTSCATNDGAMEGSVQTFNSTFTALEATDILTTTAPHGLAVNAQVILTRNGANALPVPLSESQIYFVESVPTATTITLKATLGGGLIDLTVNGDGFIGSYGLTAGYTFNWFESAPTGTNPVLPINYFTNPPDFAALVPNAANPSLTYTSIPTGLYSLEVTDNATGCRAYVTHTLPFIGSHAVIRISKTNTTVCPPLPDNGSITIRIEDPPAPPPGADYNITLKQGASTIAGPFNNVVQLTDVLVSNTLSAGTFIVEVEQDFGTNCILTQDVTIGADARDPIITLSGSIIPNTACDVTQFDGRIDLNVDKDPDDLTPFTDYDVLMVPAIATSGFPLNNQLAGNYSANDLGPGNYTFTATDNGTGCSSSKTFTVLNNPVVSQFVAGNVVITDAEYCNTILERSAKVVVNQLGILGGGPETLADYEFTWRDALNTTVHNALGNAPNNISGGDEFINQVPAAINGTVAPGTVKAGTYTVIATKRFDVSATGGVGCTSAPFTINIQSNKITPQISLTPTGDSSCDPTFFEGSIEVDVTTASGPGSVVGATYNYDWNLDGGPAVGQPADAAGNSGINNLIPSINEGSYTVIATNELTGCFNTLSTTLVKDPPPVFTLSADATNLTNCNPILFDGKVDNVQVFIDGLGGTETDFDYTWFKTNLTTLPVIDGSDDATYPVDDELTLITYPAISIDTYFVKAIRKAGGAGVGCESTAIRKDILDDRVFPTINFATLSSTSCNNNFDGQITVTSSTSGFGPATLYNFDWTANPALTTITDAVGLASPRGFQSEALGGPVNERIGPGNYNITVTNTVNSCATNGTVTLLQNTIPVDVVNATSTPLTHCTVPDGSVTAAAVTVNGIATAMGNFSFAWTGTGGPYAGVSVNNLADGDYFVTATKTAITAPASGCASPPFKVTVDDTRRYPVAGFTTLSSTSCNNNFDGQITVTSTTTGFGPATLYNFDWTANPALTTITDAVGLASPRVFQSEALGGPVNERIGPGDYNITITNTVNSCTTLGTVTLLQNSIPIEVVNATSTPLTHCTLPDGSVTATAVNVSGIATALGNFTFSWTGPNGPFAGVSGSNLVLGDYFVTATKTALTTPASGCSSPPFKVTVNDNRRYPVASFTTISSTSCDNNFDGQITVTTTTTGFGPATLYDFNWITRPAGTTITDVVGLASPRVFQSEALGGPVNERIGPGAYQIRITNASNLCFTDAAVSLISNPQPLDILTITKQDQEICFADGSIAVQTLNSGAIGDYTYEWFRNSVASAPLVDAGNAIITTNTLSAPTYVTMGAGTYFVRATKNVGLAPGSGCITPPFRVDILDLHEDPQTQFSFTPNSSCNISNPNGIVLATATERDATIDAYTFTWQYNGGALAIATAQTDLANTSTLNNSPEGNYNLNVFNTITGCSFAANLAVNIDLSLSLPNIITVNKLEPTTCIGDGSAEVTSISIGGGPALSGAAIAPPNFEYEWYDGAFTPANLLGNINPLLSPIQNGKYFVLVKDLQTDCESAPTEVELVDQNIVYPVIEITLTTPQISCDALIGTGVLVSTADGQTDTNPTYTFSWFPSLDLSGTLIANTSTINGLRSGNYSLQATNTVTGCSKDALYIVPDNTPQFAPQLSMSAQERTLCIGQDGAIFAGIVNINPAYPFPLSYTTDLYFGDKANDPLLPTLPPDQANIPAQPGFPQNFSANNLTEGFYTVRIVDNNTGCVVVDSEEVIDGRKPPVVVIKQDNPMINCDPLRANGQLSATADNNQIAGYTFDWYTGVVVPPAGVPLQSGDKLIGQVAGDYIVRVARQLTGCVADKTGTITDGTVSPPAPTALVERDRTNCIQPNGWVSANVNGVKINHLFQWYDGGTTKPSNDFAGPDYFDRDIGPYTVTATDLVTGCISLPTTVTVQDKRVTPEVELTSKPALCLTPTGSVNLTLLNNQEVILTETFWTNTSSNGLVGSGPDVYNLPPGFYTADYMSSEGCEGTGSVEVTTEILSYNLVSVNGDGANDFWIVDCLQNFPDNNVKVFNRSGVMVYEADGYNNVDVVFRGIGEKGIYALGNELPDGTYFYIIDKRDGSKPVTGYLELVR